MATNQSNSSIFNPDIQPTQEPFYLNLSRPISDQKNYGTGLSEGLKGAAQLGTEVVTVAHELTQENLDDKIHAGVDTYREAEIERLNKTLGYVSGGIAGSTTGTATSDASLVSGGGEASGVKPPSALQNVDGEAAILKSARESGKLSRSDYTARLYSLAKDLRSQYPGWVDHIDDKFASITGERPANALIKERIADINSWIGDKKDSRDKLWTEMLKHIGEKDMNIEMQLFKSGVTDENHVLGLLNKVNANKVIVEKAKLGWELEEGDSKNKALKAGKVADAVISQHITDSMDTFMTSLGLDKNPAKAAESFKNATAEQAVQLKNNLENQLVQMRIELRNKLNIPDRNDPNHTVAGDLGQDKVAEKIEKQLEVYKSFSDFLAVGKVSRANVDATVNKALQDGNTRQILKTSMGEVLMDGKTIRDHIGNAADVLIPELMRKDLGEKYNALQLVRKQQRMSGRPDPTTGEVPTLKDSIAEAYGTVQADPDLSPAEKKVKTAQLADTYITHIEDILKNDTPLKLKQRYAQDLIDPRNKGLLNLMVIDGYGPNGERIPGRYSAYNRLYSPEMSDAMFKLGPTYWDKYKEIAKSGLQSELILPEITRLNQLQLDPNVKLGWDNVSNKFNVTYGRGINEKQVSRVPSATKQRGLLVDSAPVSDATVLSTDAFVTRLNTALSTYSYVAARDQKDMSAFLLDTLMQLKFDPTISYPTGIDKKMIDAIVNSNETEQKRKEEAAKKYEKKK